MADKTDPAALDGFQSGLLEPVAQKQREAEGAGLRGQAVQAQLAGRLQRLCQQQAAEPLTRMIRAHIEQAEVAVIAQGDKA